MKKVLICGQSQMNRLRIRGALEANSPFQFEEVPSLDEVSEVLADKNKNLLLLDITTLTANECEGLNQLRAMGFSSPILILAEDISVSGLRLTLIKMGVQVLYKPFEDKELVGITRKLVRTKRILPQQKHKRYRTNQLAEIETLQTGEKITTDMYNLSMGGAYCEMEAPPQYTLGDLIRLKIPEGNDDYRHIINAKIVWSTKRGRFTGRHGVGIQFVRIDDVYRDLISKI